MEPILSTAVGNPDPYEAAIIELRALGAHVREVDDEVGGWYGVDFEPRVSKDQQDPDVQRIRELLDAIHQYHRPQPPRWSTEGI